MGLLGAHVSIAGGIENSIYRAKELECDSFQIFSRNQRQWTAPPMRKEVAEEFKRLLKESEMGPVIVHDSYLINLGSPKENTYKRSVEAFTEEILRAEMLGAVSLVMHPCSHLGKGEGWGLERISAGIDESVNEYMKSDIGPQEKGKTTSILLETTAGQGTNLGYAFEQLAQMIDMSENQDMLAVCFDTCHAFAAGYDISTEQGYYQVMDRFDEVIGLDLLKVFHINDSLKGVGSRVDRHKNIGEGELGETPFRILVTDPRFEKAPMILETPGGDEYYEKNLKLLRSWVP
jgi:deoxyribonuclease-4